jgi:hypothetical protein
MVKSAMSSLVNRYREYRELRFSAVLGTPDTGANYDSISAFSSLFLLRSDSFVLM